MIREAPSDEWMRNGLILLLAAGCLAGCSSVSCKLPNDAAMVTAAVAAPASSWTENGKGPARLSGDDVETVGSIPGGPQKASEIIPVYPPGISAKDSKLFSPAEDSRPWPLAGSPEARKQDEYDKRREREISTVVNICHC